MSVALGFQSLSWWGRSALNRVSEHKEVQEFEMGALLWVPLFSWPMNLNAISDPITQSSISSLFPSPPLSLYLYHNHNVMCIIINLSHLNSNAVLTSLDSLLEILISPLSCRSVACSFVCFSFDSEFYYKGLTVFWFYTSTLSEIAVERLSNSPIALIADAILPFDSCNGPSITFCFVQSGSVAMA